MTKEELIAEIESSLRVLREDLVLYRSKGDFAVAYVQLCTLLAELKGWLKPEPEQMVRFKKAL